ncbi:Uncharacterised protein [Klebsiella michiganensis]|nr:Uncharacterised protein [Klebsiella michiganensis]SAQ66697.1 Uncharacterised protein [Klebsiella michiganensis]SBL06161.1 Uncharacterised protein [Klebsiella michiganensis]
MTSGREDCHAKRPSDQTIREVHQQIVNRLLGLIQRILHPPVNQR